MIKRLIIVALIFYYYQNHVKAEDFDIAIVAKVGNQVISNYDIMQRLRFLSYQSGLQISESNFTQLFYQTREALIDEYIKKSAAESVNITVEDSEIETVIDDMATRNNVDNQIFKETISNVIDFELFREQIRNQLLWQKYLYNKIYQDLNVSDYEVQEYIQSAANNKFYKYDVITLVIGDDAEGTLKSAEDYYQKIKHAEISFDKVKDQFNGAALDQERSIENYANNIDSDILAQMEILDIGEMTSPFKYQDSYIILKLLDIRDESLSSSQSIRQKLLYDKFELKVKTLFENLKSQAYIERF